VQDLEVDAAFDLGLLPNGLAGIAHGIERVLLRCCDRVSAISVRMAERLRQKTSTPVVLFRNWVETKNIHPLAGENRFRVELRLRSDDVLCLYSGNLGRKQGIDLLLAAAELALARDPRLRFLICLAGEMAELVREHSTRAERIAFRPLVPESELNELLNAADIHLLTQRTSAADLVMPSKLTGILASGKPVIATAIEGTELHGVTAQVGGVNVPPEDAAALADAIVALANDRGRRETLGAAGRAFAVAELDRDPILAGFEAQLSAAVREKRT